MANTTIVKLKVKSLGKFGFFTEDSTRGYNYSKNFAEADKVKIVPGVEFEGEIYTSESGTHYLNKIVNFLAVGANKVKVVEKPIEKKVEDKPKASVNETMTKAEWRDKDRSQLIGGLSHDAAQMVAAMMPLDPFEGIDKVLSVYKEVLIGLLKIRDEVK